MKISVKLHDDHVRYLRLLGRAWWPNADEETQLANVLGHLASSAADGLRRPGAWERGWVLQAFGADALSYLKPDPECQWYEVPDEGANDERRR
jgi:hypothetical protein